jgi:hypothetical protein
MKKTGKDFRFAGLSDAESREFVELLNTFAVDMTSVQLARAAELNQRVLNALLFGGRPTKGASQ